MTLQILLERKSKSAEERQTMCYTAILGSFPVTIVAVEKQQSITYSECVSVALGTQLAIRLPHIIVCGLLRLYNIFTHYCINGTI
jgi:hypothetical protein